MTPAKPGVSEDFVEKLRRTKAGEIPHMFTRYYEVPPGEKSAEQCESHGRHHHEYHWNPQMDPGWNQPQLDAYLRGYSPQN